MTTLAELRLANLREQKKSAEVPAEIPAEIPAEVPLEVPTIETVAASEPAVVASPVATTPAATVPVLGEDDLVLAQYLTDAAAPGPVETAPDPDAERSAALIARVQEMLAHKVMHPNGAKATVDMSPALFHRAKRYCLDHGNVTLRQLFLDLMTAFLDEEGY